MSCTYGTKASSQYLSLGAADFAGMVWLGKVNPSMREGVTACELHRVGELLPAVKELYRANEMPKLASTFYALAALDRQLPVVSPSRLKNSGARRGL